eukprot:jgi/Chrzof1/12771/Cz07g07010.t1
MPCRQTYPVLKVTRCGNEAGVKSRCRTHNDGALNLLSPKGIVLSRAGTNAQLASLLGVGGVMLVDMHTGVSLGDASVWSPSNINGTAAKVGNPAAPSSVLTAGGFKGVPGLDFAAGPAAAASQPVLFAGAPKPMQAACVAATTKPVTSAGMCLPHWPGFSKFPPSSQGAVAPMRLASSALAASIAAGEPLTMPQPGLGGGDVGMEGMPKVASLAELNLNYDAIRDQV